MIVQLLSLLFITVFLLALTPIFVYLIAGLLNLYWRYCKEVWRNLSDD